jgi:plasmid maintenance system antidote protein VapI
MSGEEMKACLETLRWGQSDLARVLGIDEAKARRMARGQARIPDRLASWLRELTREVAAVYVRCPPPRVG